MTSGHEDEDPMAGEDRPAPPETPVLRVITPETTAEEVAALVAVLGALGPGEAAPPPRHRPEWAAPRRLVRRTFPHGPGGWRSSGLPR